ncbi:MAG: carboxypeptidase regulatory-like domain-containing protein [Opitutaceae bacterium]|nr:carboxypeptidase regulatory-like domain-containing protein [Opitutaceae bacterium]
MNLRRPCQTLTTLCALGIALFLPTQQAGAADGAAGTIEGRVFNPITGANLENARLSVEGTGLETFTDDGGRYRFVGVPSGTIRIRTFFTGLEVSSTTVSVAAGTTVQHDISLSLRPESKEEGPITLDKYVVTESQQMEGAAIAINEQRFSPNLKTVVAADEFGAASEGDVGEFLKYLPGVSMDYLAGDARQVSLGGADFNYTPVTFGGFGMTNGNQGGTNRGVSLEYVSLNNLSRVEVINSPTPESPGAALAGSINFVPRTAFERTKPLYTANAYISMRDDRRDFHRSVGPRDNPTRKVQPGFEFSAVVPVSPRFGFSVSGTAFKQYSARDSFVNTWRGANAVTNGGTFPDTTPDRPYLSNFTFRDGFLMRKRTSVSFTLDYRLARNDRVSLSFTRSTYNTNYDIRGLLFAIDQVAPGGFAPNFTRSAPGRGTLTVNTEVRDRNTTTYMPTLVYRHDGPVWKAEAGAGLSHSRDSTQSGDRGFFSTTSSRRTGVTLAFDDVTAYRPGRISATDAATGTAIDPFDVGTYVLNTAQYTIPQNSDTKRSVYGNLRRDFGGRLPFSLKAGFDLQNHIRDDTRSSFPTNVLFNFVGRDGRPSTGPAGSDDLVAPFFFEEIATRPGVFGFPAIPVVSSTKLWSHYQTSPAEFRSDDNTTYRNSVAPNKRAEETISALYLRGDTQFFDRRLKLVGGLRAEQTNIDAEGPLTDPTGNFQRRADGSFVLGANGRPLLIHPTSDALAVSRLTYIARDAHVTKEYLRWFPSLNASFSIRENFIARAAGYTSIGRPNFNQYSGGITLPDTEADPASNNRIVVNNAGIKPWSARTVQVALEYYFARVGLVSVTAYRRNFENFFGTTVQPVTNDFLALYSLDPNTYGDYDVSTQYNITDTIRMDGLSFNYKQALTFLPSWARGVQVFANGTAQHASGGARGNFQYSPGLANAGISLTRARYSVRIDANHRGRQRVSNLTGRGIQPDTSRYAAARTSIDLTAEHRLWRTLRVFAKFRNVTDVGVDFENYGPLTPDHARFQQRERYGALWTFGIKGTF